MNLAYYYVDLDGNGASIADLMLLSAKKALPGVRTFHLTDSVTRGLGDIVVRSSIEAKRESLMVHRLTMIELFVKSLGEDALLVDPDVLIVTPPPFEDCDIGLTWREPVKGKVYGSMPFNTGVMFSSGKAGPFWNKAADISDYLPKSMKAWFGDQMAIALLVGLDAFDRRKNEPIEVAGCRVRFYPCATHNFTPETEPTEVLPAHVVHFKGAAKEWLPGYYRRLMCA